MPTETASRPALRPDCGPPPDTVPARPSPGAAEALAGFLLSEAGPAGVAGMEALAALAMNLRAAGLPPPAGLQGTVPEMDALGRDPRLAIARRIARRALAGQVADPTGGALRFHGAGPAPAWSMDQAPCHVIGPLCFYK